MTTNFGRKPERYTREQRVVVIEQLKQDLPVKFIAANVGCAHGTVCRLAVRVGLRRMYVTDQERAEVLAKRKVAA